MAQLQVCRCSLGHLDGSAGKGRSSMAMHSPGRVCEQRKQHHGKEEVTQVVGPKLHLKAVLGAQLGAGHHACRQRSCRSRACGSDIGFRDDTSLRLRPHRATSPHPLSAEPHQGAFRPSRMGFLFDPACVYEPTLPVPRLQLTGHTRMR